MFGASVSLPQNPREAHLLAEQLEALALALREWPLDAWQRIAADTSKRDGLFERLAAQAAPFALDPRRKALALDSAECTAAVLRSLWPTTRQQTSAGPTHPDEMAVSSAR